MEYLAWRRENSARTGGLPSRGRWAARHPYQMSGASGDGERSEALETATAKLPRPVWGRRAPIRRRPPGMPFTTPHSFGRRPVALLLSAIGQAPRRPHHSPSLCIGFIGGRPHRKPHDVLRGPSGVGCRHVEVDTALMSVDPSRASGGPPARVRSYPLTIIRPSPPYLGRLPKYLPTYGVPWVSRSSPGYALGPSLPRTFHGPPFHRRPVTGALNHGHYRVQ